MRAVKERAAELVGLQQRFAGRLVGHLEALIENEVGARHPSAGRFVHARPAANISATLYVGTEAPAQADWCVGDKNRFSKRGELRLYAQQVIHQKLLRFEQLLQWLAKCDPARLETVGKARASRLSHSAQRVVDKLISRVSVASLGRW